jgi:copper resistance protein B
MMRAGPALFLATLMSGAALAAGEHDAHEPMIFWGAGAEVDGTDAGWLGDGDGTLVTWEAFAWVGGDDLKLRLEAEGKAFGGDVEESELRAFASWNIAEFWDLQAGLRHDFAPDELTWAAVGVHGMAPYFFETDAHVFVSEDGDAALRLEQSIDLAVTQDLFLQPHAEVNVFAQDAPELGIGAGFSGVEFGLQARYEFSRKFAPYADLVYERALGETASLARAAGEDVEQTTLRLGLRVRL